MRIDDELNLARIDNVSIDRNININIAEIDELIKEIETTENSLRRRPNNKYRYRDHVPKELSFKYITSSNINDIDDVIIDIETPEEYYRNKEKRIVQYTDYNAMYIIYRFYLHFMNIIGYILNIIPKIVNRKKIKEI